jgi:hypothetical protein
MRRFSFLFISTAILVLFCSLAQAGPITITDVGATAYWGATIIPARYSSSFQDVIGIPDFSVETLFAQNYLQNGVLRTQVVLTGPYFSYYQGSTGLAPSFGPGDLYISSTGWQPSNSSGTNFQFDTFTATEGWDYVVRFVNPTAGAPVSSAIYSFNPSNGLQWTNAGSGYVYRQGQAWQGGYGSLVSNDVTISLSANSLVIDFPSLGEPDALGYHWTMRCGNDVVEGGAPVPEPGTILLLGTGLIMVAVLGKRRIRK